MFTDYFTNNLAVAGGVNYGRMLRILQPYT